jgi:hypothetical protein
VQKLHQQIMDALELLGKEIEFCRYTYYDDVAV